MAASTSTTRTRVKPGITARGFITAVKDYKEPAVVEELAANSYDADATTVLVLLDPTKQQLHVIDDGSGFTRQAIETAAVLGGGDKREVEYSLGKRDYLGAYGFGLKATVKIAHTVTIETVSADGSFKLQIDWRRLEEALRDAGGGFDLDKRPTPRGAPKGTHIILDLKNPTDTLLDSYHRVLSNLPDDSGKCRYYTGFLPKVPKDNWQQLSEFKRLRSICAALAKRRALQRVSPNDDPDLKAIKPIESHDKQDPTVTCRIYFAGFDGTKVRPLKKGLRGIYVRIQGRLLKSSFDDQKYVYPISKWVKFAAGLRVELTIDWLRGEISLSREGLTFSNPKLEEQFRATLARNVSAFIGPQLKHLAKKEARHSSKRHSQRLELAQRRAANKADGRIRGLSGGFVFKPETDGELALVLAHQAVLQKVNPHYRLIDYNDQAPFDCILYDTSARQFVFCELEPTLVEFLQHKNAPPNLRLIITWTLGKWRMGAIHRGVGATYKLVTPHGARRGHYQLLSFTRQNARTPSRHFDVVALEELFGS